MSGLLGGGHATSAIPTRYNGIQVSTSSSGTCITLGYGQFRASFNLMWYGAFSSTPTQSSGGKGGGGGQTTGYNYKASFAAGICEGPIGGVLQVWLDKDQTSLSAQGLTLFTGSSGQAVWSYLTTNFASQAIPYDHICYVGAQNYTLGQSAALPNISFEVQGLLTLTGTSATMTAAPASGATSCTLTSSPVANGTWTMYFSDYQVRSVTVSGTAVSWSAPLTVNNANAPITASVTLGPAFDADPSQIIADYLTNTEHGAGFPASSLATLTGSNSYQSYCLALGLQMSPMETTQRAASDFVTEILQITNSAAVWSAGTLKIIPYADTAVSGNGYTYTPNLTPVFIFTDDDFLEPPELTRKPTSETYNHVRVEFLDRSNEYNTAIAEVTDLGDIALTGERIMDTLSFHELTNSTAAGVSAQLILQTNLYERNTIKFKVRVDYSILEPMDFIAITDSGLGYVDQVCQVRQITDSDLDELEITAVEIPGAVRTSAIYNWANTQGYNANYAVAPGSVQAPAFFEAYGTIVSASGGRELWVAVGPQSASATWGGCQVYVSFDNVNYEQAGTITAAARYGILNASLGAVADPDTTSTIGVTLNNTLEQLGNGTTAQADSDQLLIAVGSGSTTEVISYAYASLVTAGEYNLSYLRRGQYQTQSQSHSAGAQFIRLDNNLLKITLDPGYLGVPIYFKFTSFNLYSRGEEQLSAVTAYSYTPGQALSAYNASSAATFVASGPGAVMLSPTSAFKQNTGSNSWDCSVYSTQTFTNGCSASCYASNTVSQVMLGLTTNPGAGNSYTNLNYGLYATNIGTIQIYESGTYIGAFGTYNNNTMLNVVYDGKHVSYYAAGVLLRTVPVTGLTLYMQVCFSTQGGAVYGLNYSQATPTASSFTLSPMSINVAASGTTATPNGLGAAATFGIRNFQSLESYSAGCVLSFTSTPVSGTGILGLSTAPTTGDSTGIARQFAAFLCTTGAPQIIYNGTNLGTFGGSAQSASDIFTIEYDTYQVYWYRNNTLVYKQAVQNPGPLYLFGDFAYPTGNMAFTKISFGNDGALSPNPWIATNGCSTHDSTVQKFGGTNGAWDSAVYSLNAYPQCHIQCKPSSVSTGTCDFMLGLATNPTASSSYTNLNYAIQMYGTGYSCYESGTNVAWTNNPAPPQTTDLMAITYDGANVRYYVNGQLLRTVAATISEIYGELSFADVGAGCTMLSFGPGTTLDSVGTAGIDVNGATSLLSTTYTGVTVPNSSVGGYYNLASLTVGPFPTATTIVLTASGLWAQSGTATGGGLAAWLISTVSGTSGMNIAQAEASYPATSGYSGALALEISISLAANTTQTYWLNGSGLGAIGGGFSSTGIFKAEVIKR